jgi:hypothetical protein
MLKQLYLAIEQKLMAINDGQGQPLFKHFDLWNRQVEFIEQETPFVTPAVFVEFMPVEWRNDKSAAQDAMLSFRLHIVTPWYANTAANVVDPGIRATALDYLDIPSLVFKALNRQPCEFGSGNFSPLYRTASIVNHDHERFVDSVEEYRCHLRDCT